MDIGSNNSSLNLDTKSDMKSKASSKGSRRSPKKSTIVESEDISLSQLELMANKKKLTKKASHDSISNIILKKASEQEQSTHLSQKIKPPVPLPVDNSTSTSSSSSSSSTTSTSERKQKERKVLKENKSDDIRKEKSELLYKLNKLNVKGKWSSLKLCMESTLDEIRNEYERVRNEIQTERSVAFFKRMLLLGVQGVEMLNTKFDPMGVDLEGWSESMGYSMENQEYDEVMAELYEKYKGRGQMSPEVKLIFMIISSGVMFSISKRITKMDTSSLFKNILGGFVGNNNGNNTTNNNVNNTENNNLHEHIQQMQQQQLYQQQMQQQQLYQQQMQQQQYEGTRQTSETSEDLMPSKINAPSNNLNAQDGVELNRILQTMNDRKKEKNIMVADATMSSEDLFKNISLNTGKRGRGRPRKMNNNSVNLNL